MDRLINICENCTYSFPECDATVEDITFGDGLGNDNVCSCKVFEEMEREK